MWMATAAMGPAMAAPGRTVEDGCREDRYEADREAGLAVDGDGQAVGEDGHEG